MTPASLILALLAGTLTLVGLVASLIPGWGAAVAFSAPVAALAGLILGGMAMSRATREGKSKDLPVVAVVLNGLAFFPAVMVALTCGVCNAVVASGPFEVQRSFRVQMGFPAEWDGGMPMPLGEPEPGDPPALDELPADDQDPSALPPPPLPAGPRT